MDTNLPPDAAPDLASAADGLRDIVEPVRIIPWWEWVLWGALLVLVLGAAAGAFYLWWRARQRRRNQPSAPARLIPPHERALRQLDDALRLLSDPDPFCTEVSRILRVYIEERFGWNAPDRTTEEFLFELRHHHEFTPDQQTLLQDFLIRCDLVKFARHDPTETELRGLHDSAVRLVTDTVPSFIAPPPGSPADGPLPSAS